MFSEQEIIMAICKGNPIAWFIAFELSKYPIGEWVPLPPSLPGSNWKKWKARQWLVWLGVAEFERGLFNWVEGRCTHRLVQIFLTETTYYRRQAGRKVRTVKTLVALPEKATPREISGVLRGRRIDRADKIGDFNLWLLLRGIDRG